MARPVPYISGSRGSVILRGKSEPYPVMEPHYPSIGSNHQMLPGVNFPGNTDRQDMGYGAGMLEFKVNYLTPQQKATLDSMYRSWAGGSRESVIVSNGVANWICKWLNFQARRSTKPQEFYIAEFSFILVSS